MLRSEPTLLEGTENFVVYCDARTKTDANEKEENVKAENLGRLIKPIFEARSDGIQCFERVNLVTVCLEDYGILIKQNHTSLNIPSPRSYKMYQDLKKLYLWPNKKADF
ncbi:hypothetical protein Tco_0654430 [Tanacetum coccineum]|uniref:Integrase zinc-binding domain-containing protein n=1 Tax=Tanacetum coccineum TaxID=301880 RepID=A0ABQ4X395_9ASTR